MKMEDKIPEAPFYVVSEEPFVAETIRAIHHIDGNNYIEGGVLSSADLSADEVKEVLAEAHDSEPSSFLLGEKEIRASARGRMVVGFSRWNSSWDPAASGIDPSMN